MYSYARVSNSPVNSSIIYYEHVDHNGKKLKDGEILEEPNTPTLYLESIAHHILSQTTDIINKKYGTNFGIFQLFGGDQKGTRQAVLDELKFVITNRIKDFNFYNGSPNTQSALDYMFSAPLDVEQRGTKYLSFNSPELAGMLSNHLAQLVETEVNSSGLSWKELAESDYICLQTSTIATIKSELNILMSRLFSEFDSIYKSIRAGKQFKANDFSNKVITYTSALENQLNKDSGHTI